MSYYELWAVLGSWRSEFSASEFGMTFFSPDPRKVLHDMVEKGLLERTGRGRYRVRAVGDYVKKRNDVAAAYELLRRSRLPYALTGVDGVFVWTRGGYNADRFFGFYPVHLKILESDLGGWRGFFSKAGRKFFLEGKKPRETLFGVFYLLYPVNRVKAEPVEGLMVEPIGDTLDFCKKYIFTFEPALEMLRREYRKSAEGRGQLAR